MVMKMKKHYELKCKKCGKSPIGIKTGKKGYKKCLTCGEKQ
jgi:hypothetical protein